MWACMAGAVAISGAVIYREWQRRNRHITIAEMIVNCRHIDFARASRIDVITNCAALIEWGKRPAESIDPEDMAELVELLERAKAVKSAALRSILFSPFGFAKFGYIEQYRSLKDHAT